LNRALPGVFNHLEFNMNLIVTGHHLEITSAIRSYVEDRVKRISHHFDHVIDVTVTLSVEKLNHKAEAQVHLPGKDIHVEAIQPDMYAAIDALEEKLDRQIVKHKEKLGAVHRDEGGIKRASMD